VSDERPAWRKQLEQSFAELEALGKQVGSTLGEAAKDASHEAKKAWHELEPRLHELRAKVEGKLQEHGQSPSHVGSQLGSQLGTKLREVGSDAAEQLEGMVAELRSSLKSLRDKL
jgi:ElaB/YqjD/DUF883 family membrane-anchored ribosome-binding protein